MYCAKNGHQCCGRSGDTRWILGEEEEEEEERERVEQIKEEEEDRRQ